MRADRLVATLLLLQARGRVTAAEVATEFEISLATARRDLEALSTAGVPVYSQPGRGGGWSLVGGARTDLTGLTAAETRAIFLLVGPAGSGSGPTRSALRKLMRALPETFRGDAAAAIDAVTTDAAGWGAHARARLPILETLQEAVVGRRRLSVTYEGRARAVTVRTVDPWGLVDKDGVWYLLAGTKRGRRTFRVDRIREVTVLAEGADRPVDLDLGREWDRVVEEVEHLRSGVAATVLAPAYALPALESQFGRHCELLGTDEDGRVRVRVSAHLPVSIAERLAGWGSAVEVREPESVRAELARLGAELLTLYGGP